MKKEKLILICVLIIGVSIIVSQIIKQNSIERQANAKIEQERQAIEYQKEQDEKAERERSLNKLMLDSCLNSAEDAYWDFMELNGTGKRDGKDGVTAATRFWDSAEESKKNDINNCYKRYRI